MQIIHVIESGGGSTEFVLLLVKHLKKHHHHIIYGERTFGSKFVEKNKDYPNASFQFWKYAQRELKPFWDFMALIVLIKLISSIKCNVVHLHSSKAGFLGRVACFLIRRKNVVYTPNGWSFIRKDISALKRKIYFALEISAAHLWGKVICCSKSEADAFGKGVRYINNGTIIKREIQISKQEKEEIIIVTTGRICYQKGPELFNSIALAFENNKNYQFRWVGDGELAKKLTSRNILVTGWMNKTGVEEHLQAADIYLSTALWEGLPFSVLEAMNYSLPLVLYRAVGNIDLVSEGINGYVFETLELAKSTISIISENLETRKNFGRNSKNILINHFNAENMATSYDSVYNEKD